VKRDVHKKIRQWLEEGRTQEYMATELGRHRASVAQMIRRMEMRGDVAPRTMVRDPKFVKAVVDMYRSGVSVADISVRVNRNMSTCYAIIRQMIDAGALEGRRRGRPLPDDHDRAVNLVIKMTEEGATIAEIAVEVNRSQAWVTQTRMKKRAEGVLKFSEEHLKRGKKIDWETKIPQIRKLIEAGHAMHAIAYVIGVSNKTLQAKLRELGIQSQRQKALAGYRERRSI
jgi:transposase